MVKYRLNRRIAGPVHPVFNAPLCPLPDESFALPLNFQNAY
jgi:hypothetical protein